MSINEVIDSLKNTDVFTKCSRLEMSKLYSYIEIIEIKKGENLFKKKDEAVNCFFLVSGKVSLLTDEGEIALIEEGFVGEEAIEGVYKFNAVAIEDSKLVAIHKTAFEAVFESKSYILDKLYQSFMSHFSYQRNEHKDQKIFEENNCYIKKIIGWSLAILIPFVMAFLLPKNCHWSIYHFSILISAVLILWIFRLMSFYLPMFMILLSSMVLEIVPKEVALSGFTSSGFILALCIWGLSIIIIESHIFYRFFLWLIMILPPSLNLYLLAILFINIVMTPFVPLSALRYRFLHLLEKEVTKILQTTRDGKLAIVISIFYQFGPFFLTGTIASFMIYSIFSVTDMYIFTWGIWFYSAIVVFLVALITLAVAIYFLTRKIKIDETLKKIATDQLKLLGPLKGFEWLSFGGMVVFIVGVITINVHHYDISLISFGLLIFFLISKILDVKVFEKRINWMFLIYLGIAVGFIKIFTFLQMPQWIMGDFLISLSIFIKNHFYIFIVIFAIVSAILSMIFFPIVQLTLLLCFLLPIAAISGIDFWVLAFIAIVFSRMCWSILFNPYYKKIKWLLLKNVDINNKKFLLINFCYNFMVILGLFLSVSFWRTMGLL